MRIIFLLLLALPSIMWGQSPDREFRGMWIATVKNIDWPSQAGLPSPIQQKELTDLLDSLQTHGFNAVILQIRPAGDALYDSPFEPWSEWLTGRQGQAPRPLYDPLEFAVKEAHKRNMELHAWINPFRAGMDDVPGKWFASNHVAQTHPEWTLKYGSNRYIDPGIPAAREYVMDVVMDIANRYDVDAIHFDDYFYPYAIAGQEFPDTLSYRQFGGRYLDIDAWRRNNIDEFILQLHNRILAERPDLQFGISPFGVWRNQADDPLGSATRAGITSYDGLHADIRKWLRLGWIDYVAPQLYFSIGFAPADFAVLLEWWQRNSFGKNLYIGHSPYKINNNADPNWTSSREIPRQIEAVRRSSTAKGSIFFSAKWLKANPLGWADSLQNHYYQQYSFPPTMTWLDPTPPLPPAQVEIGAAKEGMEILWIDARNPDAAYYCIYRAEGKETPLPRDSDRIGISREQGSFFLDKDVYFGKKYSYLITARDKHHNESDGYLVSKRYWRGLLRQK
ncbi:MAG: family 10 glycosylhydrolase [Bacteroidia bacterium]|nr:family 10 glycosylhydrolase [Bacteroidia bacterium]